MRILLVCHDFLPNHPSGTEIYTWQIGTALRERGHEVHVFTTDKHIGRPNLRIDLREYGGLPVHELVNNLFYNDFRETWDYPPAARTFGIFLDDLKPDVVHFMHLMYLSVDCVEEARKRGLPVIFTLHDYWLQCARFGQRVHADKTVCHEITFERCGDCLSSFKFRQSRGERALAKSLAAIRTRTGLNLAPAALRVAEIVKRRLRGAARPPAPGGSLERSNERSDRGVDREQAVRERDGELRRRLLPHVYRFLAPSRFLRDSFLAWGIPPGQIRHSRAGIDLRPFAGFERIPGDRVRVAFIGTLAPHKGPHLLLEAWSALPAEVRAKADLAIYGPKAHNPGYVRSLEELAARCGARMGGGLDRDAVVAALARVDLLVVPSLWYENSPLIILEALATRTPVAVTDLGGMAELVEPGVTGFRFAMGDAQDLAGVLRRAIEDPRALGDLYPAEYAVKGIDIDACELEVLYAEARAAVEPP
jgi:glycosyltransferase involved in cell wall biosynthesis